MALIEAENSGEPQQFKAKGFKQQMITNMSINLIEHSA
jgi:hypothetical protein